MAVTCAFYGFVNRATKVILQVDQEQLQVGQAIAYEGDNYIILSVFETAGHFQANVGLEQLHRVRLPSRMKTVPPPPLPWGGKAMQDSRRAVQESALQNRLRITEATLQGLLRERDVVLKWLEEAIQQLDRIHQNATMEDRVVHR